MLIIAILADNAQLIFLRKISSIDPQGHNSIYLYMIYTYLNFTLTLL